jgi:flavin reductase (DIM6/NTAB) family NADH-FMN oxidoreductase RutF
VDKFERASWSEGPDGLPLLDDCPSLFAGRVLGWLDCGDHEALLLEPFAAHNGHGDEPFPFHRAPSGSTPGTKPERDSAQGSSAPARIPSSNWRCSPVRPS